jgi:hypothetical protein
MPSGGYGSWSGESVQGSNPGVFTMWNEWSDIGNGKKKKVYDQEMGVIKGDACVMGDNIFDYAFFMFD